MLSPPPPPVSSYRLFCCVVGVISVTNYFRDTGVFPSISVGIYFEGKDVRLPISRVNVTYATVGMLSA